MKNVIWFALGAIVGAAGGYYYAYRKAEARADEEIEEMTEYYRDKNKENIKRRRQIFLDERKK